MPYRYFSIIAILLVLYNPKSSFAKQVSFQKNSDKKQTHFQYSWTTTDKQTLQASFSLPNARLQTEQQYSITPPMQELLIVQRDAVNTWGRMQSGALIQAYIGAGNSVGIELSGTDEAVVNRLYLQAEAVREEAKQTFLQNNGYQERNQAIFPDFAALVQEYSLHLQPIAKALKEPDDSFDTYVQKVLSFVQNIPYDHSKQNIYRRPISVLIHNKGDCDSKAVLFLSLIRAAYPTTPAAVVDIPEHAFVLLGAEQLTSSLTLNIEGQTWAPIESVGPNLSQVGDLRPESLRYLQSGNFRLFPVPR